MSDDTSSIASPETVMITASPTDPNAPVVYGPFISRQIETEAAAILMASDGTTMTGRTGLPSDATVKQCAKCGIKVHIPPVGGSQAPSYEAALRGLPYMIKYYIATRPAAEITGGEPLFRLTPA